jgi:hypothetical protein
VTWFVVRRKSDCSRVEAKCDREAPKLCAFGARWDGTIADLNNLNFIQIVLLCLVAGREQGHGNETW